MKASIYQDKKREWRWRIKARNGRIVADSGEGYRRRVDAGEALYAVAYGDWVMAARLLPRKGRGE